MVDSAKLTGLGKRLLPTLGNRQWVKEHELKAILPDVWTHIENLNGMQLGFKLKLLGIDWRSEEDFGLIMVCLEKMGLMLRQNEYSVRANPSKVFS